MARLAFLSPLPPAATGIADYGAEVLALLADRHRIEAFHAQASVEAARLPVSCDVRRAEGFLERHRAGAHDLAVYQMGNGPEHDFLYDLLPRAPGLLVLHDLVLHHSRARTFLESREARAYARDPSSAPLRQAAQRRLDEYRAELAYCYPAQAERLAEAQLATVGGLLPYAYPLFRLPVEAARVTAVHNACMLRAVREEVPSAQVVRIPMPVEAASVAPAQVAAVRARLGIGPGEIVVGSFGLLTREKRVESVARAVARALAAGAPLRLLLVGPVPDPEGLAGMLERLALHDRAVVAGRVPFEELAAHIEAADIAVHLRYPTARETSAALLRVLAQGRPAVISDLEHLDDIPADAVVRADVADEEGEVTRAILRLASSEAVRARLGRAARAFVEREHAPARCLEGYEEAIAAARRAPDPPSRPWPSHWPRPERTA